MTCEKPFLLELNNIENAIYFKMQDELENYKQFQKNKKSSKIAQHLASKSNSSETIQVQAFAMVSFKTWHCKSENISSWKKTF